MQCFYIIRGNTGRFRFFSHNHISLSMCLQDSISSSSSVVCIHHFDEPNQTNHLTLVIFHLLKKRSWCLLHNREDLKHW